MATWLESTLDDLAGQPAWGYERTQAPFSEPTALVAMALLAHGRLQQALPALGWLVESQDPHGALGINREQPTPWWPTSQAAIAWSLAISTDASLESKFAKPRDRALEAMDRVRGKAVPKTDQLGHDMTLIAWPWVEGTHSWSEPTAWQLLALKFAGRSETPRAREAVRLLVDRLLPDGGCNYGNTVVLGQTLRPHIQPTGCVLIALADEADEQGKIRRTRHWLASALNKQTTTMSLAYGLMGLAAGGFQPESTQSWLEAAHARTMARGGAPPHRALLALAALPQCPLVPGRS